MVLPVVAHLEHTTEHGGAELALRRLLSKSAARWDARLLLSGDGPDLGVFTGLDPGVSVNRSGVDQPPGASTAGLYGSVRTLIRIFREGLRWRRDVRSVDVVHANTSRSALVGAIAVMGSNKPFVVHLRDRVDAASLGSLGYFAFRFLVARQATTYIANSQSTADSIQSINSRAQVDVLASPIGVDAVSPHQRSRGQLVRIGMVARLDSWKGQDLVIRAFHQSGVSDRASLSFFGDASFGKDDYAAHLRELVSQLQLKTVSFEGFVDDIGAAVDDLDICVQFSTRAEPLGQNVLQYLARGRASIVADEGGPTEWVTDGVNGVRVEPRNISALADAIRGLVDDSELRARLGNEAARTPGLITDDEAAAAHADVFCRCARLGS